jgi:hypothetical protein
MAFYSQFPVGQEDLSYEYDARESYLAELRAEHEDPCWDNAPEDDEDIVVMDLGDWLDDIDF